MKEMLNIAGFSKQALFKYREREKVMEQTGHEILEQMHQLRQRHKRMGCRKMYYAVKKPLPVGRDKFEAIGFSNGYKLKRKISPLKTTWSQRVEIYPNLVNGMKLNNINQVWQSDIFYFRIEGTHYYGVTIVDVYSRKLLALHASRSLRAEQTAMALRKAIKAREGKQLDQCIFHSDYGSQYISNSVKQLIRSHNMRMSMCKMPQENAYAERIQGTLKNDYIYEHALTANNLKSAIRKIMGYYNNERPHDSIGKLTPTEFESHVEKMVDNIRPEMTIYQGFEKKLTIPTVFNKEKSNQKRKSQPL